MKPAQIGFTVVSLAILAGAFDTWTFWWIETFVPLGGEYDAMINYLTVEKARFRDSLVIECHIDPSVRNTGF